MDARAERTRYSTPTRLALLERDATNTEERQDDHELRLRALERLAFRLMTIAAVGGSLAGIVAGVGTALILELVR